MVSITLSVEEKFKDQLKQLLWVNWSEIAREETIKKLIFERYLKTGEISDKEWEFCERIDWHPVDELPLKKEFIEKISKIKKEKGIKFKNMSELRKIIEE
ncbi:MAG: hypothetical protein KKF50_00185 [Nanoarchaeota archaeon]|nr:hypothetical protein [Nanoarchaeota archaeon]